MTHPPLTDWPSDLKARWDAIQAHPLDTGRTAGLPQRLAREHRWSRHLVRRVISEYRRFCLLAVDRRGAVAPSPMVDAVWHAHLLYTTDYWATFCPCVLGFDLHHVPSAASNSISSDSAKPLDALYADTLARYRDLFGKPPPADIWPPPGGQHPRLVYVDTADYVLLPRRLLVPFLLGIAAAIGIMMTASMMW